MYGASIREARESRGLSQVQLAEVSGIAQANISAIETDRRRPSAETLHRLLTACGFELVAMAGPHAIPLPPPLHDDDPDVLRDLLSTNRSGDDPSELGRAADPATTNDQRSRVLRAVLDASEAIIRSR